MYPIRARPGNHFGKSHNGNRRRNYAPKAPKKKSARKIFAETLARGCPGHFTNLRVD
jgi:hypothetical protein